MATPGQLARRVAESVRGPRTASHDWVRAITAALRAERERCAWFADRRVIRYPSSPAEQAYNAALEGIAAAIREGREP